MTEYDEDEDDDGVSPHILHLLSQEQRDELRALGTYVQFPPEQTIFWQGQPSYSVLLTYYGGVKITQQGPDGQEVMLTARGADELIGDECALLGDIRTESVTTLTPVTGFDIKAEDFRKFVEDNKLWPLMYRAVVRRRRESDRRTVSARLDVRYLLAQLLLDLANEVGAQKEGGEWTIQSLTQKDLAGRIGASRDAVAKELGRLREENVVATGRRQIVLRDLKALRKITMV